MAPTLTRPILLRVSEDADLPAQPSVVEWADPGVDDHLSLRQARTAMARDPTLIVRVPCPDLDHPSQPHLEEDIAVARHHTRADRDHHHPERGVAALPRVMTTIMTPDAEAPAATAMTATAVAVEAVAVDIAEAQITCRLSPA